VTEAPVDALRRRARDGLLEGAERAPARAHFRAMGVDPARLGGPIIGVASTWTGTMPCNLNQRELADRVNEGVSAAGGLALGFNTIAVSDNQSQGTPGMRASLISREVIADSIELMVHAHDFDGLVCVVGCDKTVPAALMALARVDKPAVLVYNGPMRAGRWREREVTILDVWEAVGAEERGLTLGSVADFKSETGKGVVGSVDGRRIAVGNKALFEALGIDPEDLPARADERRTDGQGVMLVAVDGRAAGLVAIADPIKESAVEAIKRLRADGIRVIMLTGDSRITAAAVGRKLGIDDIAAEVLPHQKAEVVRELQQKGRFVAMAGDGINDAPALAQAEVGIAMGTGADVAMESAAVTLLKGDLQGIVRARQLSRATMRNIRQNLFFAFAFNALAVPIAAGVLYPWTGLLLNPMIASAAMSLSSVTVISNALRLRSVKL